MYSEKQYVQSYWLQWVAWSCMAVAIAELAVLTGYETGVPRFFWSYPVHLGVMIVAAVLFLLLKQTGLLLQISKQGLAFRFSPFHITFRHVRWAEIRHVRLIQPAELPLDAPFGYPGDTYTQIFLLSHRGVAVLKFELITGKLLFISTENPDALLDFLQHELIAEIEPNVYQAHNAVAGSGYMMFKNKP